MGKEEMENKFDLIVIGGGSGLDIANAAAQQGLKVALIEKDRLGGTCLNRGCIPSKLLIHSADIIETIRNADTFGVDVKDVSINFQKIMERVNNITDLESDEIKNGLMQSDNPKLFAKECRFIGKKKIAFTTTTRGNKDDDGHQRTAADDDDDDAETITADKIVIATGTKPKIPRIHGLEKSGFITSDEALRLKKQPESITFIGGGYIACELAHFFGSLGTKINIIQRNSLLIPSEDDEVAQKFTEVFGKKYNVYLGYEPTQISKKNNKQNNDSNNSHTNDVTTSTIGDAAAAAAAAVNEVHDNSKECFSVKATKKNSDGKPIEVESEQLIVSAGRIPNTDSLDLEKTGVMVNEAGFIIVDIYLQTTMPGIFAVGDVAGKYQFKHSANLESQYAFNNILSDKRKLPVNYAAMPHAIFSSPQIAGVGFTEQELKEEGTTDYAKSIYPFINTGMGQAIDDKDGFVKFLINKKNRKILGCHIIGTDASVLIHEVLVSMREGNGTIDSIYKTIHIHPSLSEVVSRAASEVAAAALAHSKENDAK
jgi:dihydrolipoamide dehydrogenase